MAMIAKLRRLMVPMTRLARLVIFILLFAVADLFSRWTLGLA
jgi:hypothetical protein